VGSAIDCLQIVDVNPETVELRAAHPIPSVGDPRLDTGERPSESGRYRSCERVDVTRGRNGIVQQSLDLRVTAEDTVEDDDVVGVEMRLRCISHLEARPIIDAPFSS
jgi:hypothetical protein